MSFRIGESLEDLFAEPKTGTKLIKEPLKTEQKEAAQPMSVGRSCPAGIGRVPVSCKAMESMYLMADAVNELAIENQYEGKFEVYAYALSSSDRRDQPAVIDDIFIPKQTATAANVTVDPQSVMQVKGHLQKTNKNVVGWTHSHGQFPVFSSATDNNNHRLILDETSNFLDRDGSQLKYMYEVTVNAKHDKYGVILTQFPCGNIVQSESKELVNIIGQCHTDSELKQRAKEIRQRVAEAVNLMGSKAVQKEKQSMDDINKALREEITTSFVKKLWQSKRLLNDKLENEKGDEFEKNFEYTQDVLREYDKILADGAVEAFSDVSEKFLNSIREYSGENFE